MRGLGKKTIVLRQAILSVLDDFDGAMSSRQVAYQLVNREIIPNRESEKERILGIIVDMRRDGSIPYSRIVDRSRAKHHFEGWAGLHEVLDTFSTSLRLDMWRDQPVIPMVALEKGALSGIFSEIVDEYGVSLWTFGGFNSVSFDYEWSVAIEEITDLGKRVEIAYFGDHDPSGICIEETSLNRLRGEFGVEFGWERKGLLVEDFDWFGLAEIPINENDPRANRFLQRFAPRGAELDALPPGELKSRIRGFIEKYIDRDLWERTKRDEQVQREALRVVAENWETAVAAAGGAA